MSRNYAAKSPEEKRRECRRAAAGTRQRMLANPRRELLKNLKRNARKTTSARRRAVEFNLTEADLAWPTHCPVLGIELHYPGHFKSDPAGASFDRLNGAVGYVKGNVIVVSHRANAVRSNATAAELRRVADFYEFLD